MSAAATSPVGRPGLAARIRDAVPEPARERARMLLARRLELRLRRSAHVRAAALVLHAVGPRAGDADLEIDPAVESRHLDAAVGYLARRYALVRAGDLPSAARRRRRGERLPIAITFDDDLASHLEHASPVLARHGAVATAFLCGTASPFWWQLLQIAVDAGAITGSGLPHIGAGLVEPALERHPGAIQRLARAVEELAPGDRDEVAAALERAVPERPSVLGPEGTGALAANGWEIGFHTRGHYLLTTLDDKALRSALERHPGGPTGDLPCTLAYPHGKAMAREAGAAREAGYVAAFTGYASVLSERTDDHLIGRLQPDTATLGRFALQLARALSAA